MPRLFEWQDLAQDEFHVRTIADITDDREGSVPCNLGEGTMEDPVYGVTGSRGFGHCLIFLVASM